MKLFRLTMMLKKKVFDNVVLRTETRDSDNFMDFQILTADFGNQLLHASVL